MRKALRAVLGAAAGLLAVTVAMPPAQADWDHGGERGGREHGDGGREHDWRERNSQQHDWREHVWRRWDNFQEPPVVYAPQPRYYAAPPRYYAAPPAYYAPAPGYYGD